MQGLAAGSVIAGLVERIGAPAHAIGNIHDHQTFFQAGWITRRHERSATLPGSQPLRSRRRIVRK
ncbi:hypothetical protein S4A8_12472 [Salinisphaera sp. S4-8]